MIDWWLTLGGGLIAAGVLWAMLWAEYTLWRTIGISATGVIAKWNILHKPETEEFPSDEVPINAGGDSKPLGICGKTRIFFSRVRARAFGS